jgi:hypothetical protein
VVAMLVGDNDVRDVQLVGMFDYGFLSKSLLEERIVRVPTFTSVYQDIWIMSADQVCICPFVKKKKRRKLMSADWGQNEGKYLAE